MGFWTIFFLFLGSMALSFGLGPLLYKDQSSEGEPEIAGLEISQIKPGAPVCDVLGTTKISKCTFMWYGLERSKRIRQEIDLGLLGSDKVTVGYKYFLSWALGVCIGPIDAIYAIYANDDVVWSGYQEIPASGGEVTLTLDAIGDVTSMGDVTIYFGTTDQVANAAMTAALDPDPNPAYKGICYAYFDDCYIGNYNRCPTMKFVVKKRPTYAFNSDEALGSYEYNPAHALWHIMVTMLGLPDTYLDSGDFSDAADTLFSEELGVNILFQDTKEAITYIESILNHIDGGMRYGG